MHRNDWLFQIIQTNSCRQANRDTMISSFKSYKQNKWQRQKQRTNPPALGCRIKPLQCVREDGTLNEKQKKSKAKAFLIFGWQTKISHTGAKASQHFLSEAQMFDILSLSIIMLFLLLSLVVDVFHVSLVYIFADASYWCWCGLIAA